jgi:hypothetical protein
LLIHALVTAGIDDIRRLWPHLRGSGYTYHRIAATWRNGAPAFAADRLRFSFSAPVEEPGDTLHVWMPDRIGEPALRVQLRTARPDVAVSTLFTATSGVAVLDAARLRIAADEIAAYDESRSRSWTYLDGSGGPTFQLPLLAALADSVRLTGTITGVTGVSTPAGSFMDAVLVRYVVDFGWGAIPGRPGDAVRGRTRGEIYFAPDVGPVLAREIFIPIAERRGAPPAAAFDSTFTELQLLQRTATSTTAEATTWSRIKQRFR